MKNIYLTGFMCSGKSSTARQIGRKLSQRIIDVDEQIRRKYNMDIGSIFDKYGEAEFRKAEEQVISDICSSKIRGKIISLGGGTIFNQNNLNKIKKNGIIIYLRANPDTIYQRVKKSKVRRPLLEVEDVYSEIVRLMNERCPIYEKNSDIIIDIDGRTSYETSRIIIGIIKKEKRCRR